MKNLLIVAIALIVLAGIVLLLTGKDDTSNATTSTETTMDDTMHAEDEQMHEMDDMDMTVDDAVVEDTVIDVMPAGDVKEFTMDAFNFGYSVNEIVVNEGDTVKITITSTDGFHDWVVDEFNAATSKIQTGGSATVTFVADKAGTYEYYCSVGQHRANGMVGTLIVQ